jgi:hypothetical protein
MSPLTPIILVTAYLSGQVGKTIVEGEAEFIGKPIEPEVSPISHPQASPKRFTLCVDYLAEKGRVSDRHFRPVC